MSKKKRKINNGSPFQIRRILRVVKLSALLISVFFTVGFGFPKGIKHAIDYFTVKKILVTGNSYISPELIRESVGILPGQSIFAADMDKIRQAVGELPNIDGVVVRRIFPDIIGVRVAERSPVAIMEGKYPVLVDNEGFALEFDLSLEKVDLPVLTGFDPENKDGASARRMELAQNILQTVEREDYPLKVSEINLSDPDDLVLYPDNIPISIHLAGVRWAEQLDKLKKSWDQIKTSIETGDRLDLRFRHQIVKRPAKLKEIVTAKK